LNPRDPRVWCRRRRRRRRRKPSSRGRVYVIRPGVRYIIHAETRCCTRAREKQRRKIIIYTRDSSPPLARFNRNFERLKRHSFFVSSPRDPTHYLCNAFAPQIQTRRAVCHPIRLARRHYRSDKHTENITGRFRDRRTSDRH